MSEERLSSKEMLILAISNISDEEADVFLKYIINSPSSVGEVYTDLERKPLCKKMSKEEFSKYKSGIKLG